LSQGFAFAAIQPVQVVGLLRSNDLHHQFFQRQNQEKAQRQFRLLSTISPSP